jgi:hypothetical protein
MIQESPDMVMIGSGSGSQQESPMMMIQQNNPEQKRLSIEDNRA